MASRCMALGQDGPIGEAGMVTGNNVFVKHMLIEHWSASEILGPVWGYRSEQERQESPLL